LEIINLNENFSAHRTKLEWILFGSNDNRHSGVVCHVEACKNSMGDIENIIHNFINIEQRKNILEIQKSILKKYHDFFSVSELVS